MRTDVWLLRGVVWALLQYTVSEWLAWLIDINLLNWHISSNELLWRPFEAATNKVQHLCLNWAWLCGGFSVVLACQYLSFDCVITGVLNPVFIVKCAIFLQLHEHLYYPVCLMAPLSTGFNRLPNLWIHLFKKCSKPLWAATQFYHSWLRVHHATNKAIATWKISRQKNSLQWCVQTQRFNSKLWWVPADTATNMTSHHLWCLEPILHQWIDQSRFWIQNSQVFFFTKINLIDAAVIIDVEVVSNETDEIKPVMPLWKQKKALIGAFCIVTDRGDPKTPEGVFQSIWVFFDWGLAQEKYWKWK